VRPERRPERRRLPPLGRRVRPRDRLPSRRRLRRVRRHRELELPARHRTLLPAGPDRLRGAPARRAAQHRGLHRRRGGGLAAPRARRPAPAPGRRRRGSRLRPRSDPLRVDAHADRPRHEDLATARRQALRGQHGAERPRPAHAARPRALRQRGVVQPGGPVARTAADAAHGQRPRRRVLLGQPARDVRRSVRQCAGLHAGATHARGPGGSPGRSSSRATRTIRATSPAIAAERSALYPWRPECLPSGSGLRSRSSSRCSPGRSSRSRSSPEPSTQSPAPG